MSAEDFQGIAEHCYNEGCDNWITGASDYCSPECEFEDSNSALGTDSDHD